MRIGYLVAKRAPSSLRRVQQLPTNCTNCTPFLKLLHTPYEHSTLHTKLSNSIYVTFSGRIKVKRKKKISVCTGDMHMKHILTHMACVTCVQFSVGVKVARKKRGDRCT